MAAIAETGAQKAWERHGFVTTHVGVGLPKPSSSQETPCLETAMT